MIIADTHSHSEFSGDSNSPMLAYIEKAMSLGLTYFCFTDHHDLYYPEAEKKDGSFGNIFSLDIPNYIKTTNFLKDKFRSKIHLLTGIELGLTNRSLEEYKQILSEHSFDFVIASIHLIEKMDPYYPEFWLHHDSQSGIKKYFMKMLEMLEKFDNFDSLGHLDYVFRYILDEAGNPEDRNYSYSTYADLIEPVLVKLIDMKKALEVNTGGFRAGLGVPNPQPEVLKRYYELGGDKITIGSGCHRPESIAHSFAVCEEILKEIGFTHYEVYENRKAIRLPFH